MIGPPLCKKKTRAPSPETPLEHSSPQTKTNLNNAFPHPPREGTTARDLKIDILENRKERSDGGRVFG